jgi:hypothetical protein
MLPGLGSVSLFGGASSCILSQSAPPPPLEVASVKPNKSGNATPDDQPAGKGDGAPGDPALPGEN